MVYRLKAVRYKNAERRILLQNENGPCPLLAAANALLLNGTIIFPAHCIRNGVASLTDVTNMLANQAMLGKAGSDDCHFHVDVLLEHIPKFQYGMDVNPKFTEGITGYEYTSQLTAFDLFRVKLVHGWLVDPEEDEVYRAIGKNTYNSLVEKVIQGSEASTALEEVEKQLTAAASDPEKLSALKTKRESLNKAATEGSLINNFLQSTSHQLTIFGLQALYETLQNEELTVFFRNNHFGTLTKHEGILYLLVTDLGYANTPEIVWEKLDVIDGDTEYVNSLFKHSPTAANELMGPTLTPEQLMAQSGQKDADYHLALHLSRQQQGGATAAGTKPATPRTLEAQEGDLMAAATAASLREYHGLGDGIKQQQQPTQVQLPPPAAATGRARPTVAAKPADGSGGTVVRIPPSSLKPTPPTAPERVAIGVPIGMGIPVGTGIPADNRKPPPPTAANLKPPPPAASNLNPSPPTAGNLKPPPTSATLKPPPPTSPPPAATGPTMVQVPAPVAPGPTIAQPPPPKPPQPVASPPSSQEDTDRLLALQLQQQLQQQQQQQARNNNNPADYYEQQSLALARQLQEQENRAAAAARQRQQAAATGGPAAAAAAPQRVQQTATTGPDKDNGCVIS